MDSINKIIIIFKDKNGKSKCVEANEGENLMHVAVSNEIPILAVCGGCLNCATCHILTEHGEEDYMHKRSEDEVFMLEASEYYDEKKSYLSCQATVNKGMHNKEFLVADLCFDE